MSKVTSAALAQTVAQNLSEGLRRIPEWQMLTMVIELAGGRYSGAGGYVYPADGSTSPVSPNSFTVSDVVDAYLAEKFPDDMEFPVAMLVQFDRVSGQHRIVFENDDPLRWKVTPRNFKEMPEKMRPNFNDEA